MITIVKVSGRSMLPKYQEGDYLLLLKKSKSRLKVGKDIVFNHKAYGVMIKEVSSINKELNFFTAKGLNIESISEEKMGEIPFDSIIGYPIYHFKK
jgi:signal peptidase I